MTINLKNTGKYIKIDGSNFYTTCIGEGEPIVFLHGGPGSEHRFFLPHVLPLSKKFKLILYDQRGCGKSEPSKQNHYSMTDEVDTLELLRIEFGLKKVNLFGESWGSMLALLYAAKHPDRVNKILLTAAIGVTAEGFITFGRELEKRLSVQDKEKLSELEGKLKTNESSLEDIFKILDPYYVYSNETLKHKEKTTINHSVNQSIGSDILKNYDLIRKLDVLSKIPILVAQGSHDILTPALIEDMLLKSLPHARIIEIENCGHWTVVEQPEKMNEIAREFFITNPTIC